LIANGTIAGAETTSPPLIVTQFMLQSGFEMIVYVTVVLTTNVQTIKKRAVDVLQRRHERLGKRGLRTHFRPAKG
jgi:hypothetical protein